jgi:hypothetical protein
MILIKNEVICLVERKNSAELFLGVDQHAKGREFEYIGPILSVSI